MCQVKVQMPRPAPIIHTVHVVAVSSDLVEPNARCIWCRKMCIETCCLLSQRCHNVLLELLFVLSSLDLVWRCGSFGSFPPSFSLSIAFSFCLLRISLAFFVFLFLMLPFQEVWRSFRNSFGPCFVLRNSLGIAFTIGSLVFPATAFVLFNLSAN